MSALEENNLFNRTSTPSKAPSPRVSRSGKLLSRRQMARDKKGHEKKPVKSPRSKKKSNRPRTSRLSSE